MWGRIDIMIAMQQDMSVSVEILYDTGRQVHTVARGQFKTRFPIDYTMDPSFVVN